MALLINIKNGISLDPTAFIYEKAELKNSNYKYDIQNLILGIELHENIFSPTLRCTVVFKDSLALSANFKFHGEETFTLKWKRVGLDGVTDKFSHVFKVAHWDDHEHKQEREARWAFTAISEEAYNNDNVKISRAYMGNVVETVKDIAKTVDVKLNVSGRSSQTGDGVIPICTPFQAIHFLQRNLLDDKQTPYYFFQSNDGKYNFMSHAEVVKNNIGETYYYTLSDSEPAKTVAQYKQRKYRMMSAQDDYSTSKYWQTNTGLFASKNTYVSLPLKHITRAPYDYKKDFPRGETLYPSPGMRIDDKTFGIDLSIPYSHERYISADNDYAMMLSPTQSAIRNAWESILSGPTMQLQVPGNLKISPGSVINLEFLQTIDGKGKNLDKYKSGKYVIVSTVHQFLVNEWYTLCTVKRDSINQA
jgi:hypothetical protein